MKELHFQITLLLFFLVSLVSSVTKNIVLLLFSSLSIAFLAFNYKRKSYLIFSAFLILFSILIFYVSSFSSYELFIYFTPLILLSFILLFIFFILYRFLIPPSPEGTVLSYDSKTSYAVVSLPFDFFSGIQAGEYPIKSTKKLKIGGKVKIKVKFRLFSIPKMVLAE